MLRRSARAFALGQVCLVLAAAACQPRFTVPNPPTLHAPNLVYPAAASHVDSRFPVFSWEAVAGATYYVITITEDGSESGRQIIVESSLALAYSPTRALRAGGHYTWKVAAANDAGLGPESASRPFSVLAEAARPGAPVLTDLAGSALRDGARVSANFLNLHWQPRAFLADHERYELQFTHSDGTELASWLLSRWTVDARHTYRVRLSDAGLTHEGELGVACGETYRWRVRVLPFGAGATPAAVSAAARATAYAADLRAAQRAASGWSQVWSFSVPPVVDAAPVPRAPADGAAIRGGALVWAPPGGLSGPVWYEYELLQAPGLTHSQRRLARGVDATASDPLLIGLTPGRELASFSLAPGQTYAWRVRAAYAGGMCWGPWSALRQFTWHGPPQTGVDGVRLPDPVCVDDCSTPTPGPSPTPPPPPTRTPRPSATPAVIIGSPPPIETAPPATAPASATPAAAAPSLTPSAGPKPTELPLPSDPPKPTDAPPSDTPKPTDPPPGKPTDTPKPA